MANQDSVNALTSLGFTGLEAEVYAFLLQESPATGYRVAQAIGKPVAGTYKSIESLQAKGALMVAADGKNRLCRAVPWRELLDQIEQRFQDSCHQAEQALSQLRGSSDDDRVYELETRSQVVQRCRRMLETARELVLADLYPSLTHPLRAGLEAAAQRGVEVILKVYQPIDIPATRQILRKSGSEIYGRMPGDVISLSVDGSEHLLAFLRPGSEEVFQALWTKSAMLSDRLHEQLVHEFILTELKQEIESGASSNRLQEILSDTRHLHPVVSRGPSYRNLLRRFGLEDGEAERGVSPNPPDRFQESIEKC
ncbi:MAG: helix-turn-helix domain-containing protein [Acidobacteriota bacterium]